MLAHFWNITKKNSSLMKKIINVLVIEDNEYYNLLLSNAIKQSVNSLLFNGKYQLVIRSVTDATEYLRKLKSNELECKDSIVFVDYYLGNGINATHVINLLREQTCNPTVVLLSQSKEVKEKSNMVHYDYFVEKDQSAPALCSHYLQEFIENNFSHTMN
jgi:hypothetical protein